MDIGRMMAGLSESSDENRIVPITGTDAAKYREAMKHVENLKPGDKLRWKGKEYKSSRVPEIGEVIEVFRVGEPGTIGRVGDSGSQHENATKDFTALFVDKSDGEIMEYAFDSRRFKRM